MCGNYRKKLYLCRGESKTDRRENYYIERMMNQQNEHINNVKDTKIVLDIIRKKKSEGELYTLS